MILKNRHPTPTSLDKGRIGLPSRDLEATRFQRILEPKGRRALQLTPTLFYFRKGSSNTNMLCVRGSH